MAVLDWNTVGGLLPRSLPFLPLPTSCYAIGTGSAQNPVPHAFTHLPRLLFMITFCHNMDFYTHSFTALRYYHGYYLPDHATAMTHLPACVPCILPGFSYSYLTTHRVITAHWLCQLLPHLPFLPATTTTVPLTTMHFLACALWFYYCLVLPHHPCSLYLGTSLPCLWFGTLHLPQPGGLPL